MSSALQEQINQLKTTIVELEAQRAVLGDDFVDSTIETLQEKLADLEIKAAQLTQEPTSVPTRQRKLVTLLYLDVVGSTAMTQHLDPEDTLEIMDNALPRLATPVEAHGGHVTRYTGDGFKAVFGVPVSREDDPEQAIRAGLEIIEVSQSLAQELKTEWDIENFDVRIGLDTGLAALGGRTEAEDTVMGRVVNLAVRIESAAPPGGLLISHNTYRHVRGVFNVEPQEPITAKGFPEPVPVYLVKAIKPRAFRVQTRGVKGVETRMVGRRTELDTLKDTLLTAIEEGEGQVVTISGEAGVGKSRLLYEFDNWIELLPPPDVRFFQGQGRQESQGLPYSLLRDLFTFRFQILDDDTGEQARQKIESGFGDVFGDGNDGIMRAHILGQLLGYDFSASSHLKGVLNDPEQLRNRALMYLVQYFQALSVDSPVVVFLEDIHWADDSSLDVVMRLGEHTPQLPLLIVGAARPTLFERRTYWGEGQEYHTHLELHPLSKRESRLLVAEILKQAKKIPGELRELVVSGAEGNPFYLEELIKMLLEDGVVIPGEETWGIDLTRLEQVDVPSTLAGVLQARLDSLPVQERTVLQQASVVGRLFWDRIVAYIQAERGNGGDPQLIPLALTSLRNRELVYRHEESAFVGAAEYLFKHDVLREVTYESVLKRLRKTYHGLVADWLIANSGDRKDEHNGLIADHLLLGGKNAQACEYFSMAGNSALASYANREAERYFHQTLELSPSVSLRADLYSGLGRSLQKQGRSQFDEAEQSYYQAIELYKELGEKDKLADVYTKLSWLLWDIDYLEAWNLCQEALQVLEGSPDSQSYARLLAEAGRTAFFRNVSDQVLPLCQRAQEMAERLGDMEVGAEASITLALHEDDPDKGIRILEDVITLTETEGLVRTASRAHVGLAHYLGTYLVDNNAAYRHYLTAAEVGRQIGDIERMMFCLYESFRCYISLGRLKDVDERISEFLKESTALQSDVKRAHKFIQRKLLEARGDWEQFLELYRPIMEEVRQGGSIQYISWGNLSMADTILEINRFGSHDDLAEVECMLEENIEIKWLEKHSRFIQAVVAARQKRFEQARDYILQAEEYLSEKENNGERELRSRADFELAFAEERWGDAVIAGESSIEIMKSCGYRWMRARRLIDLGDALVGRNEPGDLERARTTYQQSLDMFTEMGAPGYIKVLEERLKKM